MSDWTAAETDTLIEMWQMSSAAQIAARLQRPRASISAKAHRLIRDGVLPAGSQKKYHANPWPARSKLEPTTLSETNKAKNPKETLGFSAMRHHGANGLLHGTANLAMQPCSIHELDAAAVAGRSPRCTRWRRCSAAVPPRHGGTTVCTICGWRRDDDEKVGPPAVLIYQVQNRRHHPYLIRMAG